MTSVPGNARVGPAAMTDGERSVVRLPALDRPAVPAEVGEGGDEAIALAGYRGDEARQAVVVLGLDAQAADVAIDLAAA